MSNQVPYNLFSKWYKDTRKKIVPVQVLGAPSTEAEKPESPSPIPEQKPESVSYTHLDVYKRQTYTLSFIFLSIAIFFEIFVDNQLAILKGMRRLKDLAKASVWGAVVGLVTGLPLYFWLGVKGVVPSFVITAVTVCLVTRYYVNKIDYEKVKISGKQVVKDAAPMVKMGGALMRCV